MSEKILLERRLTTDFTFGFELEAVANGRYNFSNNVSNEIKDFIESYFGIDGNFSVDPSIEENEGCVLYMEDNNGDATYYYEGEELTKQELYNIFDTEYLDYIDFQTPFEYSSPILQFNLENIQKIINMISEGRKKGLFTTNDSCGFHHHLSFRNISGEDAAWIASQIAVDPEAVKLLKEFKTLDTNGNDTIFHFTSTYAESEYLNDLASAIRNFDFAQIVKYLNTDKFSLLNLHSNQTLEWRGPRDFLNTGNRKQIIDFYKQLYKVVIMFTDKLDMKEINGMSKENYMRNIIEIGGIRPIENFPEFEVDNNGLLTEDKLNEIIEKVKENPGILISISRQKRVLDQVIQKLFNTSILRKTLESLKQKTDVYPSIIDDIAYKYIPAVLWRHASNDAIYRTSERTLNRLLNTKYGIDANEDPLSSRILYIVPKINPELFSDMSDDYIFKIIVKSEYKLVEQFYNMLDEEYQSTILTHLMKNFYSYNGRIFDFAYEHSSDKLKKSIAPYITKEIYRNPNILKYIDTVDEYLLVSLMGYAMSKGYEDITEDVLIRSNKVTKKQIEDAKNVFTKYYKHDLDDDLTMI